jgi:hypothetical protein
MNLTSAEVSTPFFHENNTAAMNVTYETPEQSEASPVQSEASPVQSEASPVQSEASPVQSGEENTLVHVMQTSINHAARMKEYYEECACGYRCFATYGSILCRAILNNAEKEYEKLEKSKEIMMQHIRPMAMDSQSSPRKARSPFGPALLETVGPMGEGGVGAQSAPTPWRWENRTAVPVEERGACLLYRPVAYMHAFDEHNFDHRTVDRYNFDPNTFNHHTIEQHMSLQTPVCLLRENDVVDNGTVMCLRTVGNECIYGNETMKAMLKFEGLYRPKIASEMTVFTFFIILFIFVVGALTRKAN